MIGGNVTAELNGFGRGGFSDNTPFFRKSVL